MKPKILLFVQETLDYSKVSEEKSSRLTFNLTNQKAKMLFKVTGDIAI